MLDPDGDTHLYLQISEIIRSRILGRLSPGDLVASEAELQREFGVARTTARRAIRVLRDEGLIHTARGQGSFVGPDPAPRNPGKPPLFRQIAGDIQEQIRSGALLPRRPIPAEATLVRQYGVARETVRKAMALLREQGWIYTVPARGSYVSPEDSRPPSGTGGQAS
ncbi:GntR family transcriptional regulator [Nonomuraea mangrovi]|uniref:GntR family transcriptional regulator n=1 Tax=Nonomuraea mangrovi TaxID=2316207 RepID=A0ABW4TE32_9ACTN